MKKFLIIASIFGLAVAVSAQSRGYNHSSHSNRGHNNYSHSSHGHSSHSSHSRHGHSSHSSHGHSSQGHSSHRVRIWVPGYTSRVWCPPRYNYVRQSCGRVVRVCVSHGHYVNKHVPGYYRYSTVSSGYRPRCNTSSGLSVYWRF